MVNKAVPDSKQRQHRGDFLSPATRSAVMSRIRAKGTKPEIHVQQMLKSLGVQYRSHDRQLPGCPDFVIDDSQTCIFVDGDFWHGWHFSEWRLKLSAQWEAKIDATRKRDRRNHQRLRRAGWKVIRIWEHQLRDDPEGCAARIAEVLAL
ncbi:very short patch repair endonuclease [Lysobacter sp. 2RAF19]